MNADAIAGYRTVESLGVYSGAETYRARRLHDGITVLVRQLDREACSGPQVAMLQREFRFLSGVRHERIARPVALIEESGQLALVLEDFPGISLEDVLQREKLHWAGCLALAGQIAVALDALHEAQIIHGNLCPYRVLVDSSRQRVLLADLSPASSSDEEPGDDGAQRAGDDLAYCSPEQTGRMNRVPDYRTDYYSLGVLLYRMLTGCLPFVADDPLEWVHCHIARLPRDPATLVPDIPPMVASIVMKLLAKIPEDRYQSASGLQADLDHCMNCWQEGRPVVSIPLGLRDGSARFKIFRKIYGRSAETRRLNDSFERVANTGEPELVLVSGYAGVGKSALTRELRRPVQERKGIFISGKFDLYKRNIPYHTITQAFQELVQQILSQSEEGIAAWRKEMSDALGRHGQLIINVIPQVELIIGPQPAVPEILPSDARGRLHSVFARFIGVFSNAQHPLTLFFDDVQWADIATLDLLQHLLTQSGIRHLLTVVAFRNDEIDDAHPLMDLLDRVGATRLPIHRIELMPLDAGTLTQLVSDMLFCDRKDAAGLATLVHGMTGGNPFFVIQFVTQLYQDQLIRFDEQSHAWTWDTTQIVMRGYTDNVAELMLIRIEQLPPAARNAMKLAACAGNVAEVSLLAALCNKPEAEVHRDLKDSIGEGLMIYKNGTYIFLHDRIRQASYSMVSMADRARVHVQIGRKLLSMEPSGRQDIRLFEIASHFTLGAATLATPTEKFEAAELFLRAGRKAKSSNAHAAAITYLDLGRTLLGEDGWESDYRLIFDLNLELAECGWRNGNFAETVSVLALLMTNARTNLCKLAAYNIKVRLHTILGEYQKSIETGLDALRIVGVCWELPVPAAQARRAYFDTLADIGTRRIEALRDLPRMSDREMEAAMEIAAVIFDAAVFTDPGLATLLACFMVRTSLDYGNAESSAVGYAALGLVSEHCFGRYQEGYRFGMLAYELVNGENREDKEQTSPYLTKVCLFAGHLTNSCVKPYLSGLQYLDVGIRKGSEAGDLIWVSYQYVARVVIQLSGGTPLGEIDKDADKGLEFSRRARFDEMFDMIYTMQSCIRTMRGIKDEPKTHDGAHFDIVAYEENRDQSRSPLAIGWYLICKMQVLVLWGNFAEALAVAERVKGVIEVQRWYVTYQEFFYYHALSLAATFETIGEEKRPEVLRTLSDYESRYREWAASSPSNFECKFLLIAAEIARIEGRHDEAGKLYEKSISRARDANLPQHEAIAYETAARFYRSRELPLLSNLFLREARMRYFEWGALGKVHQLDATHPQLPGRALAATAGMPQVDTLSVIRASQAISSEIVLDKLLDSLMRVVVANAGARKACLLELDGERLSCTAEAFVEGPDVVVRLERARDVATLPQSILNYVRRTREHIMLANAADPHPYADDPYFRERQSRSVLCLPITCRSIPVGMLYLENDLIANAFTLERLSVLQLLTSQIAISLDNARLFADLKQENVERKRAEEAVHEKEVRIRRLVESNIIGIFFADLEGNITEANEAFLKMVGYTREELVSGDLSWVALTPGERWQIAENAILSLRQTGRCDPIETEYFRKDGSRVPVLIGAALFEGSENQGVAFVLDLTEQKQAQAERQARAEADAANRAQKEFLANMSHELRTPLNSILGFSRMIASRSDLPSTAREDISIVQRSGEHLHTLINQVLDLSKIQAGRITLNESGCNLWALLEDLERMFAFNARQKGLHLAVARSETVPQHIRTDPVKLRQILINLLSNALKFTPSGSVVLRVEDQEAIGTTHRLAFAVSDTGSGIDADELPRLFGAFVQGRIGSRMQDGTGLGLAISRSFVELMGGKMQVESQIGEGSTFRFALLVQELAASEVITPREARQMLASDQPRYRILVVDDTADARQLLRRILAPLGFDVREATDGQQAVDICVEWQPHLIWMDMRMPVMDGREATRRIREVGQRIAQPAIVALTASSTEQEQLEAIEAGCNDLLNKPFLEQELFAQMEKHLGVRFVYCDKEPGKLIPRHVDAESLASLPADVVASLKEALLALNAKAVAAAIARISAHDESIGQSLRVMTNEFQYDRILEML